MAAKLKKKSKGPASPDILTHEFIIVNHADITSCLAMLAVVGTMFKFTAPLASMFVSIQHNITLNESDTTAPSLFLYGPRDFFTVFFYMLISIVIHAVFQEYVIDKLNRRMHLSKVKKSKFNESGQLVLFYAVSFVAGLDIIIRTGHGVSLVELWEGYPHPMEFLIKFFYIVQLAYWFHAIPELYFQKLKKEEVWSQLQYISIYLIFLSIGYLLSLHRLVIVLLLLHYLVEFMFHASRLLYYSEKSELAAKGFLLWNILFILVRLSTITLAVLTLWHGLAKTKDSAVNWSESNFNTPIIRFNCLAAVFFLQAWIMWNFITFHFRHTRERAASVNEALNASKKLTDSMPNAHKKQNKSRGESKAMGDVKAESSNGSTRQRAVKTH